MNRFYEKLLALARLHEATVTFSNSPGAVFVVSTKSEAQSIAKKLDGLYDAEFETLQDVETIQRVMFGPNPCKEVALPKDAGKKLREVFAPPPGSYIVSHGHSQVEMRIIAEMTCPVPGCDLIRDHAGPHSDGLLEKP